MTDHQEDNIKIIDAQTDMIDALNDRIEELEDELDLLHASDVSSLKDLVKAVEDTDSSKRDRLMGYLKKFLLGLGIMLFISLFVAFMCFLVNAYVKIFLGVAALIIGTYICHFVGDLALLLYEHYTKDENGKKS